MSLLFARSFQKRTAVCRLISYTDYCEKFVLDLSPKCQQHFNVLQCVSTVLLIEQYLINLKQQSIILKFLYLNDATAKAGGAGVVSGTWKTRCDNHCVAVYWSRERRGLKSYRGMRLCFSYSLTLSKMFLLMRRT